MSDSMNIFDRRLRRLHRDRAAGQFERHNFLLREIAGRLVERLGLVNRTFPTALDLGSHDGVLASTLKDRKDIVTLVQSESSLVMAQRAARNGRPTMIASEELLPFAPASFDHCPQLAQARPW